MGWCNKPPRLQFQSILTRKILMLSNATNQPKSTVELENDNMSKSLEGDITPKEALLALTNMKNDKTPGTDGFTTDFFKIFLKRYSNFLSRIHKFGISQRRIIHNSKARGHIYITKRRKT